MVALGLCGGWDEGRVEEQVGSSKRLWTQVCTWISGCGNAWKKRLEVQIRSWTFLQQIWVVNGEHEPACYIQPLIRLFLSFLVTAISLEKTFKGAEMYCLRPHMRTMCHSHTDNWTKSAETNPQVLPNANQSQLNLTRQPTNVNFPLNLTVSARRWNRSLFPPEKPKVLPFRFEKPRSPVGMLRDLGREAKIRPWGRRKQGRRPRSWQVAMSTHLHRDQIWWVLWPSVVHNRKH